MLDFGSGFECSEVSGEAGASVDLIEMTVSGIDLLLGVKAVAHACSHLDVVELSDDFRIGQCVTLVRLMRSIARRSRSLLITIDSVGASDIASIPPIVRVIEN